MSCRLNISRLKLKIRTLHSVLNAVIRYLNITTQFTSSKGVYYSLAVWRFKPILSVGLRFHSHLSGGLRLRNYRAVAGNHKFSSRFSVLRVFVAVIQTELRGTED